MAYPKRVWIPKLRTEATVLRESGGEYLVDYDDRRLSSPDWVPKSMTRKSNPGIEPRKWIPVHAVRFNQDGSVSLLGEHAAANPAKSSIRKRAYRVAERTAYAAQYGKKAARKLVHKVMKRKRRY